MTRKFIIEDKHMEENDDFWTSWMSSVEVINWEHDITHKIHIIDFVGVNMSV